LRHGNIAKAAVELNIAASAVAAAIDQVEAAFDLTLITRQRSRGIRATASGLAVARKCERLLEDYRSILAEGADLRQSLSGTLRIGYYAPVAPAFLPTILASFVPETDEVELHLEECDNDGAQERAAGEFGENRCAAGVRNGRHGAGRSVRSATDMMEESWPSGVCLQGPAPNHPRAALAEDRRRERRGRRRVHVARQVRIGKASTSEPPFRRPHPTDDIKTGGPEFSRDEPIRHPAYRVGGVRRKGGASPIQACPWNCGNPCRDAKGDGQVKKSEAQSTEARHGDGPIRSSVEATVMVAERRDRIVSAEPCVNSLFGRMSV